MLECNNQEDILSITEEVLLCNADFITAWSKRREAISCFIKDGNEDLISLLLQKELLLNLSCLKTNPKSYSAWYHRHCLIDLISKCCSGNHTINSIIYAELKLSSKLLDVDSRNFHCWNYRTFLVNKMGLWEEEIDFCKRSITLNFSNRSAWHHKERLIPLDPSKRWRSEEGIREELLFLRNVYFTEPNDESCWGYLRWFLMEWAPQVLGNEKGISLIKEECEHLHTLIEIDADSILAIITLLRLRRYLLGDVDDLINLLKKIDPGRISYWNSMIAEEE